MVCPPGSLKPPEKRTAPTRSTGIGGLGSVEPSPTALVSETLGRVGRSQRVPLPQRTATLPVTPTDPHATHVAFSGHGGAAKFRHRTVRGHPVLAPCNLSHAQMQCTPGIADDQFVPPHQTAASPVDISTLMPSRSEAGTVQQCTDDYTPSFLPCLAKGCGPA